MTARRAPRTRHAGLAGVVALVGPAGVSVGCGGDDEQADVLDAYVQPVLDAIPNWDDLVAT